MRSLICFAFLMSASICMLTVTPVQVSADGDTDNLTASFKDNSDIVLADSKKKPAKAEGDEVEEKTQKQIKEEKAIFKKIISDHNDTMLVLKEQIAELEKDISGLKGKNTPEAVIKKLGGPKPVDYDTTQDWEAAVNEFLEKLLSTTAVVRYDIAQENAAELKRKRDRLKKRNAQKKKITDHLTKVERKSEIHCDTWPLKKKKKADDGKDG